MAYNYEYPYTDTYRYNDDWILNRVKELTLEWIDTRKEWNNTREEFASLKSFIQNYFAQLNLQDEVNVKLDIMARDGSLSALISPLLSEYINYVTPQMFGAIGDGVTDDTDAIKQAIENGTTTLLFPAGTYLISETLELPQTKSKSIVFSPSAKLKQSVALSPMILIGSDDGDNFPMSVSGDGVIDMDNLGGIGLQITNYAAYSHIDDVQVRNCSNGIGVLIGSTTDGNAVSLQCQLNNVKIYGKDSTCEGVGLHVNAYDCVFNNVYLYLCKTGCKTLHGMHSFNYCHVWAHAYEEFTRDSYMETVGFDLRGTSFFHYLYLDTVYTGLKTNGHDQFITLLNYQNDLKNDFDVELVNHIVHRGQYEKVVINGSLIANPQNNSMKNMVFYIDGQRPQSNVTANKTCIITDMKATTKFFEVMDEANNTSLQKENSTLINTTASSLNANKYYLIGYVKCVGGVVKLHFERKYSFLVNATFKCDNGDFTHLKSENVFPETLTYPYFYYGAAVEKYGVKWIPIYIMYPKDTTYCSLSVVSENWGECGFYPCKTDTFENLTSIETQDGLIKIAFD